MNQLSLAGSLQIENVEQTEAISSRRKDQRNFQGREKEKEEVGNQEEVLADILHRQTEKSFCGSSDLCC